MCLETKKATAPYTRVWVSISNSGICVYFTIFRLSLQFPLPCNWCLLLIRLLTSSGTASSTRNAHVACERCLSVLTFTVRYPAHSKLVFMHASFLKFPVSILSRVHVVSHPFFQKKKKRTHFHVSRRTSEFTFTTFRPVTTSSEAHWTFVRPDNYT